MALFIPKLVSNFLVKDDATQRVLTNVTNAINPLISFVLTNFSNDADGALNILQRLKSFSADVVKTTTLSANTANVGALNATGNVQAQGSVTGSTITSGTGFKFMGPPSTYSGAVGGAGYYNLGSPGISTNANFKLPFAGSVVGIMVSFICSAVTGNLQFIISSSAFGDIVATYNPNGFTGYIWFASTFAKGSKSFPAQTDYVCKLYSPAAISSMQLSVIPVFEFAA